MLLVKKNPLKKKHAKKNRVKRKLGILSNMYACNFCNDAPRNSIVFPVEHPPDIAQPNTSWTKTGARCASHFLIASTHRRPPTGLSLVRDRRAAGASIVAVRSCDIRRRVSRSHRSAAWRSRPLATALSPFLSADPGI